jgi:urea transporter
LAILLLESVFGSLLVLEIPQWLFAVAFAHGFAPWWMSWVTLIIGVLLGVLLQPHMLVGFALLHVRRSEKTRSKSRVEQIGY